MIDNVTHQYFKKIAHLLCNFSGFNPESLGWAIFFKVVKQRMQMCLVDEVLDYVKILEQSPIELNALVEATVIPETWFFRDPSAFSALRQLAATWRGSDKILRILSLPCSSGEEPYSIAITLLESNLLPNQFHLDAMDISTIAINKAIRATYTDNAFRNVSVNTMEHYFINTPQGYKLIKAVWEHVNFSVNNFFAINPTSSYDVIFCRNLLIYFDQTTRAQAFSRLHAMLDNHGLLFLGHAEAMQATHYGWITTNHDNVFRKAKTSLSHKTAK